MSSVKLSPKHGLNPTMTLCFWCGEPKNEIALLGKLKNDTEAPKYAIMDYTPCDCCKKRWAEGVAIIEVSNTPREENQPPIVDGVYPTGRMVVVDPKALKPPFNQQGTKAFCEKVDFQEMFGEAIQSKKAEEQQ